MFVTASLQIDAYVLVAEVKLGVCYRVAQQHIPLCGTRLQVIAGPHSDFGMQPVYTIQLLDPPPQCDLPYFNSKMDSAFEHVTIKIDGPY